ncbi:MAG TPA: hypothetical protein VFI47_22830, partial [Acidimicrobiales bacterium]|nr:hypothetical protein [Acidimicrobiales bacterium]
MTGLPSRARVPVAGWWSAGLVVAVAAAVDPWGFRPFTTGRWAVVGVAACGAAAAARWRPPRWLALAGAGFLALLVVATITALDPLTAVAGHPRRHLGLAGWLVCALALLAGTGLPAAARRHLGRACVVAAGITGVAALADVAGWDPAGTQFAGGRAGGLLGQPAYLGAAAVLLAPVAAGVAADRAAPRGWRRAGAAAAVACGLALVASGTRGAWLGAAAAAAVAWPRVRRRWAGGGRHEAPVPAGGVRADGADVGRPDAPVPVGGGGVPAGCPAVPVGGAPVGDAAVPVG